MAMARGRPADEDRDLATPRHEVLVSGERFDGRQGSLFDPFGVTDVDEATADLRDEMLELLRQLVATALTPRQREIVELSFVDGLSQAQIAARLGISQQVVSKSLFGVVRDGRRVGGALRRLRQLCEENGIDPERWV
jgi:RNA polymerase sigma factor (sigma-70 family)